MSLVTPKESSAFIQDIGVASWYCLLNLNTGSRLLACERVVELGHVVGRNPIVHLKLGPSSGSAPLRFCGIPPTAPISVARIDVWPTLYHFWFTRVPGPMAPGLSNKAPVTSTPTMVSTFGGTSSAGFSVSPASLAGGHTGMNPTSGIHDHRSALRVDCDRFKPTGPPVHQHTRNDGELPQRFIANDVRQYPCVLAVDASGSNGRPASDLSPVQRLSDESYFGLSNDAGQTTAYVKQSSVVTTHTDVLRSRTYYDVHSGGQLLDDRTDYDVHSGGQNIERRSYYDVDVHRGGPAVNPPASGTCNGAKRLTRCVTYTTDDSLLSLASMSQTSASRPVTGYDTLALLVATAEALYFRKVVRSIAEIPDLNLFARCNRSLIVLDIVVEIRVGRSMRS
jgi:hypothetical protein